MSGIDRTELRRRYQLLNPEWNADKRQAYVDCWRCLDELDAKDTTIAALRKQVEGAKRLYNDLRELMQQSHGVVGLHQNGDVADWESLTRGGTFEEWLMSWDDLGDALAQLTGTEI